jgi:hypothetical protein
MRIYLDLDCLTKLVAFGLFEEAMEMLGTDDVHVIDTFRFKCERMRQKAVKKNELEKADTYGKSMELLASFHVVEATPEEMELVEQLKRTSIDDGEALLLIKLSMDGEPSRLLATGDSRFIAALGNATGLPPVFENCKGRILSLNRLLARLIAHMGYKAVFDRMTTPLSQSMDGVVRMAFRPDSTEKSTMDYLYGFSPGNEYSAPGDPPNEWPR